jgi:hypothetical protein
MVQGVGVFALVWWVGGAGASCHSDLDCSLNGDCITATGKCDCDAAWEGAQCERFATLPTPPAMDIKEPEVTTWGGQAVQHGGKFHMFVSEYVGHCGITSWLTNSQTVRFVADTPKGPWTRQDVVQPVWSTCPSAAITPNGTVVLWTMSAGNRKPRLGKDPWGNSCKNGSSPCGFAKHGCGPNAPPPLHPPSHSSDPAGARSSARQVAEAQWERRPGRSGAFLPAEKVAHDGALTLLISDGPAGPWRAHTVPIPVSGASLAAPWILPNGTTFWVLQTDKSPATWIPNGTQGSIGTVIRAESWEGPYTVMSRTACSIGEDHSM